MSEPREDATPRRLERARQEGDSGASLFAARAVGLIAVIALLPSATRATATWCTDAIRNAIERSAHLESLSVDATAIAWAVLALSVPLLLATLVTTAAAMLVQTGGVIAPAKITPRFNRIDVARGFARLFSPAAFFAGARAFVYGLGVVVILIFALREHARDIAHIAGRSGKIAPFVLTMTLTTLEKVAFLGVALAAIDIVATRVLWHGRLRMTKEEIVRERRESEGDPHIQRARARARDELFVDTNDATMVVTDGSDFGCALRYASDVDAAPVVVAIGSKLLARYANAAVEIDRDLAAQLGRLGIGETIPEALYDRVADLLARRIARDLPG